jgi:hypothetical protein
MATIIEAPHVFTTKLDYTIFLAGSIENGKADDWQSKLSETLNRFDVQILNPRRRNWKPDLDGKELKHQITWEQEGIKYSDLVVFYFDPSTKSPISLLELGECLGSHKPIVLYCPQTFFRYTNVEVTCSRYGIKPHSDYQEFVANIVSQISKFS